MKVEHENLIRTLRNEPILVTSILCRFGLHKWTKWLNLQGDDRYEVYETRYQQRYCIHCNRQQIRKVDEYHR